MAETIAVQKASYPLPVYNFRVTVDGTSVSFADVSGLAIERDTITYRHGLSYWEGEQMSAVRYPKFVPLTLKKGVVPGNSLLFSWLAKGDSRALSVSLCNEKGEPVVVWQMARAIPTKLQPPTFSATDNTVAVDTLELMVAGVTVEHR